MAEGHGEAKGAVAHTEAEGGHKAPFPPFEKSTFASQLVSIVIAFVALYLIVSRIALPRVGGVLDARQKTIEDDLAESQKLKDASDAALKSYESELAAYYGYPQYWGAGSLWAMGGYPYFPVALPTEAELAADKLAHDARAASNDGALRSAAHVKGYAIHATDGSIGHVSDFIFDNETWAIRYFVVDTRDWWPGGKSVLIGVHWITGIDWAEECVRVKITRAQVKSSPVYDDSAPVHRDYEVRLHSAYDRTGYWD